MLGGLLPAPARCQSRRARLPRVISVYTPASSRTMDPLCLSSLPGSYADSIQLLHLCLSLLLSSPLIQITSSRLLPCPLSPPLPPLSLSPSPLSLCAISAAEGARSGEGRSRGVSSGIYLQNSSSSQCRRTRREERSTSSRSL